MATAGAGAGAGAGAAKNPQVPDTPRFSPARVAIALLRVAVGLHLAVDVPGQVLRSRLRHTIGQGADPRRLDHLVPDQSRSVPSRIESCRQCRLGMSCASRAGHCKPSMTGHSPRETARGRS